VKKIVVLGSGFVSSHLKYEVVNHRFTLNENEIYSFIRELRADVIINTIGYTGRPNIDSCEKNKIATYTGNVIIPLMLAEACARRDMHMVHIGSGCIFMGASPSVITRYQMNCLFGSKYVATQPEYTITTEDTGWKETDVANAESYYSKTKQACDLALGQLPNITTLRIRMPVSTLNHPRNLLNKILGYSKVVEEPNSITFMNDLVNAIDFAIKKEKFGVYHIASPKPLTHSILLEEYRKYVPTHTYTSITKEELASMVAAPRSNCILDVRRAISEGFTFGDTDTVMCDTIKTFVENRNKI